MMTAMITSWFPRDDLPGTLGLPARDAGAEGTDALAEVKILRPWVMVGSLDGMGINKLMGS